MHEFPFTFNAFHEFMMTAFRHQRCKTASGWFVTTVDLMFFAIQLIWWRVRFWWKPELSQQPWFFEFELSPVNGEENQISFVLANPTMTEDEIRSQLKNQTVKPQ